MRKLLIAFFFGFFLMFFKLTCHAQALPVPSAETLTTIQTGNEQLINLSYVPDKLLPWNNFSSDFAFGFNSGAVLFSELTEVTPENFNVVRLTTEDKEELLGVNPFWSSVNNLPTEFSVSDEIFLCSFDNGYMRGNCYLDQYGNILSYSNTLAGKYLNLAIGGNQIDISEFNALFSDQVDQIYSNNLNLYDTGLVDITDQTYYLFVGQTASGKARDAYYLYIANQYQPGLIVPENTTSGTPIRSWYANDLNLFNFHVVLRNTDNRGIVVTSGDYTKDNFSYAYRVTYLIGNNYQNVNVSDYNSFLSSPYQSTLLFAKDGYIYNPSIESEVSQAFKPLQYPEGSTIDPLSGDYFDYDQIRQLEESLNDLNSRLNDLYDYSQGLGDNNFPFYYPSNDLVSLGDSSLPLPGGSSFPDIGPQPLPSPNIDYSTLPQPSAETVGQSFGNFNIPFFNNLQYKFPFSIPWDLKMAIQQLTNNPEAPAWNFDWKIHILNREYVYHFEGDLSDFDELARVFRLLQLCSFIIFLGIFTYKQFF